LDCATYKIEIEVVLELVQLDMSIIEVITGEYWVLTLDV